MFLKYVTHKLTMWIEYRIFVVKSSGVCNTQQFMRVNPLVFKSHACHMFTFAGQMLVRLYHIANTVFITTI